MPKSDTWPGGVAMEPLINMDSAESCDSVASINSSLNDDSLEHLSAEERASLMFLVSTIESLEKEEDSGLSNYEPDPGHLASKHSQLPMAPSRLEDISHKNHNSGIDQTTVQVPTPLPANGLAHTQLNATGANTHPKVPEAEFSAPGKAVQSTPPVTAAVIKALAKAEAKAVQSSSPEAVTYLQSQITEPTFPKVVKDFHSPEIETVPRFFEAFDPATNSQIDRTISTPLPTVVSVDNMPEGISVDSKPSKHHASAPLELDVIPIPPPTDFRDNEPEKSGHPVPAEQRGPLTYNELEHLRRNVSVKKGPTAPAGVQETTPSKPLVGRPVPVSINTQPSLLASTISSPEALEPKTPPAVATKPKLPANIIMKSHKSDCPPGPHQTMPIDRSSDPQVVRMEALRMLGLLKSDEVDAGPVVSPKSWKSYASPTPPRSPAASHTHTTVQIPTQTPAITPAPPTASAPPTAPTQNITPSPATIPTPPSSTAPPPTPVIPPPIISAPPTTKSLAPPYNRAPPTTSAPINILAPVPAPAQFSDNARSSPLSTPPTPPKHCPPPVGTKSASLERSGVGLSGYMDRNPSLKANQIPSVPVFPGNSRTSRRRPASLGTGKDFVNVQAEASHPKPGHGDTQNKLPRAQGISVLICPKSKTGEDRREALKKLGLLRD
ncbi:hypothetical protein UPYG_G00008200 [Umbra pygmaea]|uniref:Specifically androgen-regulated gene protein n=1 Tax=Umbra pygmaea TaxID=75934 RepID=A0ABD0Y5B2_UMBPY